VRKILFFVSLIVLANISGCGLRGPLYMPEDESSQNSQQNSAAQADSKKSSQSKADAKDGTVVLPNIYQNSNSSSDDGAYASMDDIDYGSSGNTDSGFITQ